MDRKALISIIVPVYNVEKYIDDCLNSLGSQTYTNLEIILVDDGSTDSSGTICDAWEKKDSRFYAIHIKNGGVSHARNVGLDQAHGDYVCFVDADDWVDEDYIDSLMQGMLHYKADVSAGGYVCEYETGRIITLRADKAKAFSRIDILQEVFSCDEAKILYWEVCDKLFKKEIIADIRFNEFIAVAEDMLFFWQVMKKVNAFAYAPLFKYHYRTREGSAVHGRISPKTMSSLKATQYVWNDVQTEPRKLKNAVFGQYARNLISVTRQMLVYDAAKYADTIQQSQCIIRRYIGRLLVGRSLSYRMIIGSVVLCLPFQVCKILTCLIRKTGDR